MYSRLPTDSLRLSELFTDPFVFSIPNYQRPFSWPVEEAARLLDDIRVASGIDDEEAGETDYFLGTILLMGAPDTPEGGNQTGDTAAKGPMSLMSSVPLRRILLFKTNRTDAGGEEAADRGNLEIVDGQQRIITLLLLAGVIRDLEDDTLSPLAQRLDGLLRSTSAANGNQTDAKGSRLVLRDQFGRLFGKFVEVQGSSLAQPPSVDDLGPVEQLVLRIRDYFVEEVGRLDAAQRTRLADYLCDDCHVVVIRTHDLDRAHHMFKVLNDRGRPLQRNDIIKAELLRNLAPEHRDESVRIWKEASDQLGEKFEEFFSHLRQVEGHSGQKIIGGVRQSMADSGGAHAFLKTVFAPYARCYRDLLDVRSVQSTLPDQIRLPLVRLFRMNSTEWLPAAMLILTAWRDDPDRAGRLLMRIERFAYLLRVLCLGTGKRNSRFTRVVRAIRQGSADELDGVLNLKREDMRTVLHNLKDLHARNLQSCKLVLLRLNDEISGETLQVDPSNYSIEHVLPQRPKESSQWRRIFSDAEERQRSTVSLGNLVLITPTQNARARNEDFEQKKTVYRLLEAGKPVLEITRQVLESEHWGAAEIAARDVALKRVASRLWQIEFPELNSSASAEPAPIAIAAAAGRS